jgi:hypothetical protein
VAPKDEANDLKTEAPAKPAPAPHVRLAPIEGFDDDASYVRSTATRVNEIGMQVGETVDLPTRADLILAAVNLILARELEPSCTGRLLGPLGEELPSSEDQVREAFGRADAMLVEANTTLEEVRDLAEPPGDWIAEATHRLDTLGAFAHALKAYLLPGEGPDAKEAARRAASRLAVLLEDDRPQVTAAAALWQASLRAREADPSRAMSVLGLALSRPRQGTLPFAFFARLLRCRILASRGGHAVALALLTQLEDRSVIWMARETDRANALRAITLVEIQVLRDWYARLPGPPDSPQRRWCVDRVKTLIDEHFSEDGSTVFRLTAAIPIVAVPEDAGRREPEAPHGED